MDPDNLYWFVDRLKEYRAKPEAVVWKGRTCGYESLCTSIDRWSQRLERSGIGPGHVVGLVADYSPEAIALFVALMTRGAVIVPLSHSLTERERSDRLQVAEVQRVITVESDDSWKVATLPARRCGNALLKGFLRTGRGGLIVFSSGTSGKNKAILHDMARLMKKFVVRRHTLRTISFLLLDHLGGINTLFYILSNGGTVVTIERREPAHVCEIIEKCRVELLPTSPTFLNVLLLSELYEDYDLSSLKMITYGTEPIMDSTLRRLCEVFPNVKFLQTYGLSEIGVLRSKGRERDSRWFKIGGEGIELKVVHGELLIRADSAMVGYLNAATPFDHEGFLHTGDLVETDGEYMRITGRASDVINVGGQKVSPGEVENVILEMPGVDDVTVYGEPNIITGEIVVARVESGLNIAAAEMKERIQAFCRGKLSPYKIPARVIVGGERGYGFACKKLRRKVAHKEPA